MAKKSLTPVYLPKPLREGEDLDTYEIGVTQNEENLNQNMNYLYNKLLSLEERVGLQEDDNDG